MGNVNDYSFLSEINKLPQTIYPKDTTLDWCGTDGEGKWKYHLEKYPYNKDIKYYQQNPIKYKFNNYGYRTPYDFVQNDEVNIFLGCSYTLGVGLDIEDTWGYQLNELLSNYKFVNLAQGGLGIENQFRLLYYWKDFFKVKNIFHFQPIYAREELFTPKGKVDLLVQNSHLNEEVSKHFDNRWFVSTFGDDTYLLRKYVTNILAIQNLANRIGADYYYTENLPLKRIKGVRQARDLGHLDVQQNKDLAQRYFWKYQHKDYTIDLIDSDNKKDKNIL